LFKRNLTLIFIYLFSLSLYSQHFEEKVKRLGLKSCEKCHTTKKWDEFKPKVEFDHKKTGFDLGKQHSKVECATCHTFKTNISEKKNCKSCHFDPHKEILKSPEKKSISFNFKTLKKLKKNPDNCESCHKETTWHKVEYKHEDLSKGFVLEGAHKNATCVSCHKTQKYSDAKPDCASCHVTDYIKTKRPNHKKARFNKDCVSCHTPYGWNQARYYKHESYFPILNGTHYGFSCQTCHTNNDNYKDTTCINCHEHKKNKMDRKHEDVKTYIYDKKSCYSCHPRGK